MKLRKLIALLTAAFMLTSQFAALPVYAESGSTVGDSSSTDTGDPDAGTGDGSGTDTGSDDNGNTDSGSGGTWGDDDNSGSDDDGSNTEPDEDAFVSRHGPYAFDRLFEDKDTVGFSAFIADYVFYNNVTSGVSLTREAEYNPADGSFPVSLSYENIMTLRQYHNIGISIVVKVNVTDPSSGITYCVTISSAQAAKLTDAQLLAIRNKETGLNYSLNIGVENKKIIYKGYDTTYSNIGYVFSYNFNYADHNNLLIQAGLINNFGNPDGTLALFAYGTDQLIRSDVHPTNNLLFDIGDQSRRGVYITVLDEDVQTFRKTEAIEYIEELLNKYIGLENGKIEGLDSDFRYTKEFIANAVTKLSEGLKTYSTETELKQLVSDYYLENKPELLKAMVADIDISQQIRDELDEILGDEVEDDDEKELEDYIYEQIISEIIKLLIQYETPIDTDIFKTIKFLLLGRIPDFVEDLRDDIITSITNGKSIAEFVESLRGKDGQPGKDGADGEDGKDGTDGKDGQDGEDFEEWVVRKYGSLDNFISTISFEGWAKRNYGSVDNFVKAMTGDAGLSAYELAVENGYRGTLGMWLESLQGDDGLSAYELAVQNGYNGTVVMWLESLRGADGKDGQDGRDGTDGRDGVDGRDGQDGKDGKDGKDGRDGADAQVVYVAAGTYNSNGDDVVLITPSKTPAAGNVNPSTGIAAGVIVPVAAIGSVLLVKKGKRKRGRRR